MTEAEWLATGDPWKLLHAVRESKPSEQGPAVQRGGLPAVLGPPAEASRSILSESERLADGLVRSKGEMDLCHRANEVVSDLFDRGIPEKRFPSSEVRIQRDAAAAVCYAVIPNELWGAVGYFWDLMPSEKGPHSVIIRDVFGNPFRAVTVAPASRTPDVIALAELIYEGRAFDRMPLLGDALEEAGCNNSDVLGTAGRKWSMCEAVGSWMRSCERPERRLQPVTSYSLRFRCSALPYRRGQRARFGRDPDRMTQATALDGPLR